MKLSDLLPYHCATNIDLVAEFNLAADLRAAAEREWSNACRVDDCERIEAARVGLRETASVLHECRVRLGRRVAVQS